MDAVHGSDQLSNVLFCYLIVMVMFGEFDLIVVQVLLVTSVVLFLENCGVDQVLRAGFSTLKRMELLKVLMRKIKTLTRNYSRK